ncbi:MAG TPA: hypothetical protein VHS78_11080 [Candidatus Elarobacter sp.]|nr:hypothetical protein [Candidatus Elarobacter sp.]
MTPRYRRSSVRALLESVTRNPAVATAAHDALWAVLWNRRYPDVDEPVWSPEAAYSGQLTWVRELEPGTTLAGVDAGDTMIAFRLTGPAPAIGSRVRVLPAVAKDEWRLVVVQPLGVGIDLRFDDQTPASDPGWIETLREALKQLRTALDQRRDRLAARRAQLGALNEPPTVEEIWREEVSAISDRVALMTEYTPEEHAALARARAKGARTADEEERKIIAARKRRFTERGNEEIARFRETQWPAMRDAALAELKKYADYRTEVVRLEDALNRIRAFATRAKNAAAALDRLERSGFRVHAMRLDAARLDDAEYAEEILTTIELLHAAIPQRAETSATPFSAYRAPTAGPSVTPPPFDQ